MRAKKAAGGSSGLARRLGNISSQAVSQWRRVPAEWVIAVERETGVPRSELRPDLYPASETDTYPEGGRGPARGLAEGSRPMTDRRPDDAPRRDGHFSRFAHLRRAHFASGREIDDHIEALRDEWARR